jgi:AcrR family transcriptional regulator
VARASTADGGLGDRPAGNQRGRSTRARILEAGDLCFERSGLAVTLEEVAEVAGTRVVAVRS